MGSERQRRRPHGGRTLHRPRVLPLATALGAALIGLVSGSAPARAAGAWWNPVALRGLAITRVSAIGDTIVVGTGSGATLMSTDGGRTFNAAPAGTTLPPTNVVLVGNQRWKIDSGGRVAHQADTATNSAGVPDPGSPNLGKGAN